MSKRGISLVELLAVISILGIISGVAISAVNTYLDQAKEEAYDSIFTAASRGCETYLLEHNLEATMSNGEIKTVSLETLVNDEYITSAIDPNTKTSCTGEVKFKLKKGTSKEVADYVVYQVDLDCPGHEGTMTKVFPTGEIF